MGDKNWPDISVQVMPAKKRGGAKQYLAVVANALTVMPCGHTIKSKNLRGAPVDSDRLADQARAQVRAAGTRHAYACKRCQS